jgi:hypothetical protein
VLENLVSAAATQLVTYKVLDLLAASPHFSPGSREQAQELTRPSLQMDELSLDL